MTSRAIKLIAAFVLAVAAHGASAAAVTINFQGTITSSNTGASTNPAVLNAVGKTFTYTLNYDDATSGNVFPNTTVYYATNAAGWTASLTIGSYTFAPPNFMQEVVLQEIQTGGYYQDIVRVASYNTQPMMWSSHGLNFIDNNQIFGIYLRDSTGTGLPSRNIADLDIINLAGFNAAKDFYFIAFDPIIGANVELSGTVSSITVGPLTNVPEPASFAALAGIASLGFVALRRRRHSV